MQHQHDAAALPAARRRGVAASASAATPPPPPPPQSTTAPPHRRHHPALEAINDATKWGVSAAAFGTLLLRRDPLAAWCILGSVWAAANCKLLKRAINEARPSADRKQPGDPGMPSSHANSLAFLATFVSLASASAFGAESPLGLALVLVVPCAGMFLAWLRAALGYHTLPQVVVGWVLGGASAAAWHALGRRWLLPSLEAQPQLQVRLYAATGAAAAFFVVQSVRRWVEEWRQQRRGQQAQRA